MASIASKTPFWLSRQNRFQTLFQLPNSAGNARQVMLCTVKKCNASINLRSSRPLSPRRERAARNTSTTISQSASLICVSMIGSPKPTSYESLMPSLVNPLSSTHPIPSTRPSSVSEPDLAPSDAETGTVVELAPLKDTFDWLTSEDARAEFNAIFAPYVLQYPGTVIIYDGHPVEPRKTIDKAHEFKMQPIICPNRVVRDMSLRVIEWKARIGNRKIYFG